MQGCSIGDLGVCRLVQEPEECRKAFWDIWFVQMPYDWQEVLQHLALTTSAPMVEGICRIVKIIDRNQATTNLHAFDKGRKSPRLLFLIYLG